MSEKMVEYDSALSKKLEERLEALGIKSKKREMFGHEVFFVKGYMFAGVSDRGIYVNLGRTAVARLLKIEKGVSAVKVEHGMTMKDYLLLDREISGDGRKLNKWLRQADQFISNQPSREKKKNKTLK